MEFFRLNFPDTEKFDKVSLDHDNCNDNNESYVNITIWLKYKLN